MKRQWDRPGLCFYFAWWKAFLDERHWHYWSLPFGCLFWLTGRVNVAVKRCSLHMTWLNFVPDIVDFVVLELGVICRYTSAQLRSFRSTNARLHLVADDVARRIALLGLRRTGKQRGRRAGTQQQRYFGRHRLLPCQQPTPASGGSRAVRPWPAVSWFMSRISLLFHWLTADQLSNGLRIYQPS